MEVTLRKAAQLSAQAIQAAGQYAISPAITVSAFGPTTVQDAVAEHSAEQVQNLATSEALLRAGFAIRALIGKANRENGVDDLLDKKALSDALEKRLASVSTRRAKNDLVSAQAQLESLAERVGKADYYGSDGVTVVGITEDVAADIKAQQTQLRREKVRIADDLLHLNTNTKVTLDAQTVETLTKFDIL